MKTDTCFMCGKKYWKREVVINEYGLCGIVCRYCGWLDKIYQYGIEYDEKRIKNCLRRELK